MAIVIACTSWTPDLAFSYPTLASLADFPFMATEALSPKSIWIHEALDRFAAGVFRAAPHLAPVEGSLGAQPSGPRSDNRFPGWDRWRPEPFLMSKRHGKDERRQTFLRIELERIQKEEVGVLRELSKNPAALKQFIIEHIPRLSAKRVSSIVEGLIRVYGPKTLTDLARISALRGRGRRKSLLSLFREALERAALQQYRVEWVRPAAYMELLTTIRLLRTESDLVGAPIAGKMFSQLIDVLQGELHPHVAHEDDYAKPNLLGVWVARDSQNAIVGVQILRRAGAREDGLPVLAAIEDQGIVEGVTAVLPRAQRRGIAHQLLNAALAAGRKWNIRYRLVAIDYSDEVSFRLFYKAVFNGSALMRYLGTVPGPRGDQDLFIIDRFPREPHPVRRMGTPLRGAAEQAWIQVIYTRAHYPSRQSLSDALIRQGFVRKRDDALKEQLVAAEPPPETPADVRRLLDVAVASKSPLMDVADALQTLRHTYGYQGIEIQPLTPEDHLLETLMRWGKDISTWIPLDYRYHNEPVSEGILRTLHALANNIRDHGGGKGILLMRPLDHGRRGVEIIARDSGPGVRNLKHVAHRGTDLPSVRRLVVRSGYGTFEAASNGKRYVWDRRGLVEDTTTAHQDGALFIAKFVLPEDHHRLDPDYTRMLLRAGASAALTSLGNIYSRPIIEALDLLLHELRAPRPDRQALLAYTQEGTFIGGTPERLQWIRDHADRLTFGGILSLGRLDQQGIHFHQDTLRAVATVIWGIHRHAHPHMAGDFHLSVDRIVERLKENTELHELVTWYLQNSTTRMAIFPERDFGQPMKTLSRLADAAVQMGWDTGGIDSGTAIGVAELVHLLAQYVEDLSQDDSFGGLLRDQDRENTWMAERLIQAVPRTHPVIRALKHSWTAYARIKFLRNLVTEQGRVPSVVGETSPSLWQPSPLQRAA